MKELEEGRPLGPEAPGQHLARGDAGDVCRKVAGDAVPSSMRTVLGPQPGASRVVLVRHAEASCNVEGRVGGIRGCSGLTDNGWRQARWLRDRLTRGGELDDVVALYTSVLPRARETASAISSVVGKGGLEAVEDCDLCELHPGEADGLSWSRATDLYGEVRWDEDPSVPLSPGGESWSGFVKRAGAAVESVVERHKGERTVIVCHGGVIEAAMLRFLPIAEELRLRLNTAHTSLTEWESGPYGWRLLRYNDAAHLCGRTGVGS